MNLRHEPLYPSRRSPVLADNLVATSQPLAAQAGLSMLARGGNAVDAALAAAIALTVVEPTGNGLGSDAFCILWDGTQLHGLNASGRSPAGWSPERFAGAESMPFHGWESVTVPGAVSAWATLSKTFGRLEFTKLFGPAVGYAEKGFIVSPIIAERWRRDAETLRDQPGYGETFLPGGKPPRAGERFRNPAMANTLRQIAESHGRAFYDGSLAERIAAFAAEHGAALTLDDMANHQSDWCGTIHQRFDGIDLHEIPPNGQGIAALMALGILDHTPVRDHGPDSAMAFHYQWEAMKLAFRDTDAYVADPAYMCDIPTEALLNPDYLARRAAEISSVKATDFGAGAPKQGGTVYLTAADASGMMVSFIQSNYAGFGSGVVVPGTGIHLQNRGAGFTLEEGHPNQVGPKKRPFHSIIPGFLMREGAPLMSFGVMGGPMQAQGHLQMTLRTQLWEQDVQSAVDAPRWRVTAGNGVACETTMAPETLSVLRDMGHDISLESPDNAFGFGGAQLIQRLPGGGYAAGSDPRKDGLAIGF
ncbi:gamma-glutamyltransferase family protein [Algihabitans albus]|uniref:gamma-glutamyltransferase family protein n=1 Tax=Algihabitans albus TaxID=2164067 RepID=UPI000E5C7FCC|nr:gamma-glutamyltransferase family protein [Algihabitans albus]